MAQLTVLGFLLLPLVEIGLFIWVGGAVGVLPTLGLVVASTVAGALLLRFTGVALLFDLRRSMTEGRLPARALADAMLRGAAGMLLLLPGFVTDALGLALLLPPVRSLLYALLGRHARVVVATAQSAPPPAQRTIDLDDNDWRAQ